MVGPSPAPWRFTAIAQGALLLLALPSCSSTPREQMCVAEGAAALVRLPLTDRWLLQTSEAVPANGDAVSSHAFVPTGWYPARVPSTVVGTLVDDGLYGDPFFGMNLRSLPGVDYPIGSGFGNAEMSEESPYRKPWWYRTEFDLPRNLDGRRVWLTLDGVTFRADVWLNGRLVAGRDRVAGTFRRFEIDVTDAVTSCQPNVLAVEVWAQTLRDLGWNWVDWNPFPPDKDMGLWRDVTVTTTGSVRLRWPHARAHLDVKTLDRAEITPSVEVENATDRPVKARVAGRIEDAAFSQEVSLAPREKRKVVFPAVTLVHPRLWWPWQLGAQNLYEIDFTAEIDGQPSDSVRDRFGVRDVSSELTPEGYRLFRVNGRPILIRGAGWTPDMFLRAPPGRIEDEVRYVRDMNLNALRLEGKIGSPRLLEACDREGILVIAGWCCCDQWEDPNNWDGEDFLVAEESMHDQARELRNHPSVLVWLNGSDNLPPMEIEKRYLAALADADWPAAIIGSANSTVSEISGTAGLKMPGPYMWVPPHYWYVDRAHGGAFGFNTETSVGAAIPPLESLRKILGPDHLWPIDDHWTFHSGSASFVSLDVYIDALARRYGPSSGVEDFARKSQVAAYEGVRAMFEAYGRERYRATGVIQWMLNNAWPGLIWHLYDYFLKPGGGYFGAREANRPLHVQYSYDDRTAVVVSTLPRPVSRLAVVSQVIDSTGKIVDERRATVDVEEDGRAIALTVPEPPAVTRTYFVRLSLEDETGEVLDRNLYWLSTRPDILDEAAVTWYYEPLAQAADLTGLAELPPAQVAAAATIERNGDEATVRVTLDGASAFAFFLRAEVTRGDGGDEALPVRWDDNYLSLLPGERRELTARLRLSDLAGARPWLRLEGWNVARQSAPIAER